MCNTKKWYCMNTDTCITMKFYWIDVISFTSYCLFYVDEKCRKTCGLCDNPCVRHQCSLPNQCTHYRRCRRLSPCEPTQTFFPTSDHVPWRHCHGDLWLMLSQIFRLSYSHWPAANQEIYIWLRSSRTMNLILKFWFPVSQQIDTLKSHGNLSRTMISSCGRLVESGIQFLLSETSEISR